MRLDELSSSDDAILSISASFRDQIIGEEQTDMAMKSKKKRHLWFLWRDLRRDKSWNKCRGQRRTRENKKGVRHRFYIFISQRTSGFVYTLHQVVEVNSKRRLQKNHSCFSIFRMDTTLKPIEIVPNKWSSYTLYIGKTSEWEQDSWISISFKTSRKNQRSQPLVLLHFFDNTMYFLYIQVKDRLNSW